jgi:UDP-3-O-[3-hydroxymyristoyl] glucosamine N-acyltransferase
VYTLADVASAAGAKVPVGVVAVRPVAGVAALADAGPGDVSVVASDAFARALTRTRAGAVLVDRKVHLPSAPAGTVVLVVDDVDTALAAVLNLFAPPVQRPPAGLHPTAVIAPTARLGDGCAVGPHTVVGHRAVVGDRCALHPGVIVGDDVTIGDDCDLYPHVVLRERVTLGNRVVVHAGTVIGTDGFGYHWDGTRHAKVPQIGTVVIEDDVEIGSCVCIDRAKFGATRIGRGTKIDNLVQVAHNVRIGPDCVIVGQTGIAGSSELGAGVVLGDRSIAAARSAIAKDVPAGQTVSGMPALPHRQSLREQAALRHLPALRDEVRRLQEQLEAVQEKLAAQTGD